MRCLTSLVLVVVLLPAGCVGTRNAVPASPLEDAQAIPGSLGGIIVDDEERPVAQARLLLLEAGLETESDAGGRFVFLNVPPGQYTLKIEARGHEPKQQKVEMEAATDQVIRILVVRLPEPVPYHETTRFVGLHRCMIYTFVYVTSCSAPYTAVYGTLHRNGVNLSQLGLPPDVVDNKYRYNFSVRPDHAGIVSELVWTPNSDAARFMWFVLTCAWYDAISDDCVPPGQAQPSETNVYARKRGPSPLRIEWQHPRPDWMPWVMARARITGTSEQYVGLALDQRFEMFNTVFYGGTVPDGWSVTKPPSG